MDPEAVKALIDRVLMRLGEEVERYGGTVDKYIGDNVMAIFGAPVAHEDDEERAVRAGLGMQAAMGDVNEDLPDGVHFDLRVGVNTGEVLAGAVGPGLHRGRRHRQRRRPAAERRPAGQRDRRRAHDARLERRRALRAARAARAEGQVRARARLGGGGGSRPAGGGPRGPRARGAAGRPRRRSCRRSRRSSSAWSCERAPHLVTLVGEAGVGKSRVLRELESQLCGAADRPDLPHRPLPALRQRHRVLGAGRGAARGVRHRRHRLRRGGVGQAARVRARPVRRQGRADDARRPSARPR